MRNSDYGIRLLALSRENLVCVRLDYFFHSLKVLKEREFRFGVVQLEDGERGSFP